jgi:hypothetical protein
VTQAPGTGFWLASTTRTVSGPIVAIVKGNRFRKMNRRTARNLRGPAIDGGV